MSQLEVDKIIPQSGTTLTIGETGDTISFASGVLPSLESLTITGDLTVDTNTLFVDSTDNNVGIGTTTPSTGYGGTISNVKLALRNDGAGGSNGTSTLLIGGDNNHYSYLLSEHTGGGATYLAFGTAGGASNPVERMRIDSSGNVGIGTSSPSYPLHVFSSASPSVNIEVSGSGPNTALALNKQQGSGNLGNWNALTINGNDNTSYESRIQWFFDSISNGPIISSARTSSSEADLRFYTTASEVASERMRIDSSGDLLLAKTSEGLSNNGIELRATGQILATSTGDAGLFYRKTTNTGAGVMLTYSDVGGTESLVGAGYANGTFGVVSDINKKKNVENARNYLDDLMQIRVVKYNWKTDEDDAPKELGWIAQEVAEVFPAMVSEIDGNVLLKKEVFLPMMLKAIQELKADNDALRARIEALENA